MVYVIIGLVFVIVHYVLAVYCAATDKEVIWWVYPQIDDDVDVGSRLLLSVCVAVITGCFWPIALMILIPLYFINKPKKNEKV